MRRSLTTLLAGLTAAVLLATGLAVAGSVQIAGAEPHQPLSAIFLAMLLRVAAVSVLPAFGAIWLGEMRRIRGLPYWAIAGMVIAIAGGALASRLRTPAALFELAAIGLVAGCVYWSIAGRRSGVLAAAIEAASRVPPGAPADRRCRTCTAVTLLLGFLPLALIGCSAVNGGAGVADPGIAPGPLVAENAWLLPMAFLVGALFGYIVWRACGLPRLRSEHMSQLQENELRVAALERDNARLDQAARAAEAALRACEAERAADALSTRQHRPDVTSTSPVVAVAENDAAFLDAPRDGRPDNLKLIRGVGPRLEKVLNAMGVFHFDQIAGWTENDLAIVDRRLGDFAGRAVRDKWVEQSRTFVERARNAEPSDVTP